MSDETIYEDSCQWAGETVPEFKMETFEPSTGQFGEVSLGDLKADGKWTIRFLQISPSCAPRSWPISPHRMPSSPSSVPR